MKIKKLPLQICSVCEPKFFNLNWYEPLCKFQKEPKCLKGKEYIKRLEVQKLRLSLYGI